VRSTTDTRGGIAVLHDGVPQERLVQDGVPQDGVPQDGAAAKQALLPIVLEDGHLGWALDEGDLVATDRFGGPEPTGPRLGLEGIGRAQVVIVPALAVDTLGNRLGQRRRR